MNKILVSIALLMLSIRVVSQPFAGYYNGIEGLTGESLRFELHNIIDDHVEYSYSGVKEILKDSDRDPDNFDNVIMVYTGRSHSNSDYGIGGDQLNREHVWAKSHGDFGTEPPMGSDAHNLKPADGSVNISRSNLDFDEGGQPHVEATECYYDSDSWEPRDAVKGDIARIIFYMAVRYEGGSGELDLEVVDAVNTYPNAQHGKLSTLLVWNMQDPPDEFEIRRNNRIFAWQKNRNPFIDNPEFANLIWNNGTISSLEFSNIQASNDFPVEGDDVIISADIIETSEATILETYLYWGTSIEALNNSIAMDNIGDNYKATIPAQIADTKVYYKIKATSSVEIDSTITYVYNVSGVFTGTLTSIYDIQGQTTASPYADEIVSVTGIVTGNFGENYYIQEGVGAWQGLFVYDPGRNPSIGDSVVITGKMAEYYNLTEIKEISEFYLVSSGNELPEPILVPTGELSDEKYEGVLVKIQNAICTNVNLGYGMWEVNDGSGACIVHNTFIYEFVPTLGEVYDITGPLNYDFSEFKIDLRKSNDVQLLLGYFSPNVLSLTVLDGNYIELIYDEDVEEESAQDINNYLINNNIQVVDALRHSFQNSKVILTTTGMTIGDHILTINNVEDLSGNAIENVSIDFNSPYTLTQNIEFSNFSIFPNPGNGNLTISLTETSQQLAKMQVYTIIGKLVAERNFLLSQGSNTLSIDLSTLEAGTYILNLSSDNNSYRKKIIIE